MEKWKDEHDEKERLKLIEENNLKKQKNLLPTKQEIKDKQIKVNIKEDILDDFIVDKEWKKNYTEKPNALELLPKIETNNTQIHLLIILFESKYSEKINTAKYKNKEINQDTTMINSSKKI